MVSLCERGSSVLNCSSLIHPDHQPLGTTWSMPLAQPMPYALLCAPSSLLMSSFCALLVRWNLLCIFTYELLSLSSESSLTLWVDSIGLTTLSSEETHQTKVPMDQ